MIAWWSRPAWRNPPLGWLHLNHIRSAIISFSLNITAHFHFHYKHYLCHTYTELRSGNQYVKYSCSAQCCFRGPIPLTSLARSRTSIRTYVNGVECEAMRSPANAAPPLKSSTEKSQLKRWASPTPRRNTSLQTASRWQRERYYIPQM